MYRSRIFCVDFELNEQGNSSYQSVQYQPSLMKIDQNISRAYLYGNYLSKSLQQRSRSVLWSDCPEKKEVERKEDGEEGMSQEAIMTESRVKIDLSSPCL